MKFKVIIITMLSLIFLAGCTAKSNPVHQDTKQEQQQRARKIVTNQKIWNQRIKKARKLNQAQFKKDLVTVPFRYNDEEMSWARFKGGNQFVIVGQVLNLTPLLNQTLAPETKASIYVKNVINGDKTLQGKTIQTEFSGGLIKAGDLYKNFGVDDPKMIVYDQKPTFPMPKIGNEVIMGVNKYQPENDGQQANYRKANLTVNNFYPLNNSEVTFWFKHRGKFKLDNPAFDQKGADKEYKNLFRLTKKLNDLI